MKSLTKQEAEAIGLVAFEFLGEDIERLDRFMMSTGLTMVGLRAAAADPAFLSGVLDHISSDDALLVGFAEQAGLPPERVARARLVLAGPGPRDDE